MDEDKMIEKFMKTRYDRDEIRILKQRPAMLGDFIRFILLEDSK